MRVLFSLPVTRGARLSRKSPPAVTAVPQWFTAALANRPETSEINVDGCRIHLRTWGQADHPPLVFVHGGGTHSGWWDHIAPFFARTHRVIAPDLSGHGASGTRTAYNVSTWAREVLAAAAAAGPSGWPTVVGHGMGGWIASTAAQHAGAQIDSIVLIDSPLRDRAAEDASFSNRMQGETGYRSKEDILQQFPQNFPLGTTPPYIADHIAAESVRRSLKGWQWKFDPAIFDALLHDMMPAEDETMESTVDRLRCRIGYLHCEAGPLSADVSERIRSVFQLRGPFVELAEAGHYPMLDQPLPLVATLRTLLEMWSIT